MTLAGWLAKADELCGKGLYFEAHEELEAGWIKAAGEEKLLLQGLIQIAAGLHRLKLDPKKPAGALYLLERGRQKLEKTRSLLAADGADALEKRLGRIVAERRVPQRFAFGLTALAK